MAAFSEAEKQLLLSVTKGELQTSLALIREAVETIWAPDAPRIIQDFTDHGQKHCERVATFAWELLGANDGQPLSSEELYVLLSGIYLHDIGMQCDVAQFPSIRQRAATLGAQFDTEFTATKASGYSIEEQKALRNNHQYLTAAWIDRAYSEGITGLAPAAKKIPEALLQDVMDVCIYHSGTNIFDCPVWFASSRTGRKRLVAALLRFSDELDIDSNRVSIDTVNNFRLDPSNSAYWWLHNLTTVEFTAPNVILLAIRLRPQDKDRYGPFVRDAFIGAFRDKNRPVLDVLRQNNVPIRLDAESDIIAVEHAQLLPTEIVRAWGIAQEKPGPLDRLAETVRTWLEATHFVLSEPISHSSRWVDVLAVLDQGIVKQRVRVRCITGSIQAADLSLLDEVLDRRTPQGWLIGESISDKARRQALKHDSLRVFTLGEFVCTVGWGPYFDALVSLVSRDKLPEFYVDPGCYSQNIDESGRETMLERSESLDAYIDQWLSDPDRMHLSLLGEAGSGKTWFCRHYAHRQLEKYLADPVNERLPLLITLGAFSKSTTAFQLIRDALEKQYKLPFTGAAFDVFERMNRSGGLLLLLDAFDDAARQMDEDYQNAVNNFWELSSLVGKNSKVILTSRPESFRWMRASEKTMGEDYIGRRTIVLSPPKFGVIRLQPFDEQRIRQFIVRRWGEDKGADIAERVLKVPNLDKIPRAPVLINALALRVARELDIPTQRVGYPRGIEGASEEGGDAPSRLASVASAVYGLVYYDHMMECELKGDGALMINSSQAMAATIDGLTRVEHHVTAPHAPEEWDQVIDLVAEDKDDSAVRLVPVIIEKTPKRLYWELVAIPEFVKGHRIEYSYKEVLPRGAFAMDEETMREHGLEWEYFYVRITRPTKRLSLSVTMPPEFLPHKWDFDVWFGWRGQLRHLPEYYRALENRFWQVDGISRGLQFQLRLTVVDPIQGLYYAVKWCPPAAWQFTSVQST